jgi:hypothetical protein
MYPGIGILYLVKSKLSCSSLWKHSKYIYINQIHGLYTGNNTCAIGQPYLSEGRKEIEHFIPEANRLANRPISTVLIWLENYDTLSSQRCSQK